MEVLFLENQEIVKKIHCDLPDSDDLCNDSMGGWRLEMVVDA